MKALKTWFANVDPVALVMLAAVAVFVLIDLAIWNGWIATTWMTEKPCP